MNSGYKPIPKLFWNRLLLLIIFIFAAFFAQKFLHIPYYIDPSLSFSIFVIGVVVVWFSFFRVIENPFFTSLIPILFVFWLILDKFFAVTVHFSPRLNLMAAGFIAFSGLILFFRNLNYLWSFKPVRFFAIFAIINIFYYFFHSSGFNISQEGYMYGWAGASEGKDAKTIVFVDSILIILSFAIPSGMFINMTSKEQLDSYINKLANIFLFGFSVFFLLFPITITCLPIGKQVYLPLVFFFMFGLKVYIDNNFNKSNWFNLSYSLVLMGICFLIMHNSNKTAFLAFWGAFFLYQVLNYFFIKNKFKIVDLPKLKYLSILVFGIIAIAVVFMAIKLNIFDLVTTKFENTISSLSKGSGITSWYIRMSNWYYFFADWERKLDIFNVLVGFGLGASREAIFYITAMQYSRIYLVQTTHNQFVEMFYDYGLVSLFFYIPILRIFIRDLFSLRKKDLGSDIKILSVINVSMILFLFIYSLSDGLRVPTVVIFFTSLAFNEMAKRTLINIQSNKLDYQPKNSLQ